MPLIFRLVKGAPVTFLEGDDNLRYLEGLAISSSINFNNWTGSALSQFAGTASLALTASYALNAGSGLSGGTQYYLPVWTGASTLGTSSLYDDSSVLKSVYGGNDVGLKLDFANNNYTLGTPNIKYQIDDFGILGGNANLYFNTAATDNGIGISVVDTTTATLNYVWLGDYNNTGNGTSLRIDDLAGSSNIRTRYQSNDIGLKLDFASSKYELGQLTGGNQTKLIIDDPTNTISITGSLIAPSITGSLFGTSSWAVSASWAPSSTLSTTFISTGSVSASVSVNTSSLFEVVSGSTLYFRALNNSSGFPEWQADSSLVIRSNSGIIRLATGGNNTLVFNTNGLDRWFIDGTGPLLTGADNTHDIGLSGSRRPRNIYTSGTGSVFAALDITFGSTNALKTFPSTGNTFLGSTPTDGGFKLDVNGTTRLNGNVTLEGNNYILSDSNNIRIYNKDNAIIFQAHPAGVINSETYIRSSAGNVTKVSLTANEVLLAASDGNVSNTSQESITARRGFFGNLLATDKNIFKVESINYGALNNATTVNGLYINIDTGSWSRINAINSIHGNVLLNTLTGNTYIGTSTTSSFKLDVSGSGRFTDGLTVTGSATITNVLTLPYQDPLPSSPATGSIALSGSGATFVGMFVWTGVWTQI